MFRFKEIYYTEKQDQLQFSIAPPGTLSIPRLINNKKHWAKTNPIEILIPRTLLLNDFTASCWSNEKISLVQKLLSTLMDEGFTIYVRQHSTFELLTKENLDKLNRKLFLEKMTMASSEEIKQIFSRMHEVRADKVHVLNDYWIDSLLQGEKLPSRVFKLSNIFRSLAQLSDIIKQEPFPPIDLVHDNFFHWFNSRLTDFKKTNDIPIKKQFEQLVISGAELQRLIAEETLLNHGQTIDLKDLEHIQRFDLYEGKIPTKVLETTLLSMPELKQLKLSAMDDLSCEEKPCEIPLLALQVLEFQNSTIPTDYFLQWISHSPRLKELNLVSCHYLGEGLETVHFDALESLKINAGNFPLKNLQLVLSKTNKLKSLNLDRYDQLTDFSEDLSLTFLEEVNASHSSMTFKTLNQLIKNSSGIKKIILKSTSLNDLCEDCLDLPHLELLDLESSNITSDNLDKFLRLTVNLKQLNLSSCFKLKKPFKGSFDLVNLEKLEINFNSMPFSNVQKLLASSTNIKYLDLSFCKKLTDKVSEKLNLPNLEELLLEGATISADNLKDLLKQGKNLKILYLYSTKVLSNLEEYLNLPSLTYLDFSNGNNIKSLECLLAGAPHLKSLNLLGFTDSSSYILTSHLNLPYLDDLSLNGSAIHPQNLEKIISQACRLRTLSLSYTSILELENTLNLPSLENLEATESKIECTALKNLIANSSFLKKLNLQSVNFLGSMTEDLALPLLETLDLGSTNITLRNVYHILANSPHLKALNLENCHHLDPIAFELNLSCLEALNIAGSNINIEGLISLIRLSPKLKILSISSCANLGELNELSIMAFTQFLNLSPELEALSVANCPSFHDFPWSSFNLSSLKELDISGLRCSSEEFDKIKNKFPNLEVIVNEESLSVEKQKKPVDPVYDVSNFRQLKRIKEDFVFKFKGINKTLDQMMIIEKLSQYLTLKGRELNQIPKIQKGICQALSYFYLDKSLEEWNRFISLTHEWNGAEETLTPILEKELKTLWVSVKKYQLSHKKRSTFFLGNNILGFLKNHPELLILTNHWHAVALRYSEETKKWFLYDPNFINGPKQLDYAEILPAIESSLGHLVSAEGLYDLEPVELKNPHEFIANGGLFFLCYDQNGLDILRTLPPTQEISTDALKGLLLLNTKYYPAWTIGLEHPAIANYTLGLLQQFALSNPGFLTELKTSIQELTDEEKQLYLSTLNTLSEKNETYRDLILQITSLFSKRSIQYYEKKFSTWLKKETFYRSLEDYFNKLINPSPDNRLLEKLTSEKEEREDTEHSAGVCTPAYKDSSTESTKQSSSKVAFRKRSNKWLTEFERDEDSAAFGIQLKQYCNSLGRPVFLVNSPDDLLCLAPFIKRTGDIGILTQGPGGPLYDFIQKYQHSAESPIIIVNYDKFEGELAPFNPLLDPIGKADGIELPTSAIVIGLLNTKNPNCYQGNDFYSRFGKKAREACPFSSEILQNSLEDIPFCEDPKEIESITTINLYHNPNWKERLLGSFVVQGEQLIFESGELEKALLNSSTIRIQNGLWDDPEFVQFWQEANLLKQIVKDDLVIKIPDGFQIVKEEGYAFEKFKELVSFDEKFMDNAYTLNAHTLSSFFKRYQYQQDTNTLTTQEGLLAQNTDKTLDINLTNSLTEDEWGMFLEGCHQHHVHLNIHTMTNISFPLAVDETLNPPKSTSQPLESWSFDESPTTIIESSDPDTTVAEITLEGSWKIFNISECEAHDLLLFLDGRLNRDKLKLEFQEKKQALMLALEQGEQIILTGNFSNTLINGMADFLIKRQFSDKPTGKLCIISQNIQNLMYLPCKKHDVSLEEKESLLRREFSEVELTKLPKSLIEKECLSKLKARLSHLKRHNDSDSEEAWAGIYDLKPVKLAAFDAKKSREIATSFINQRLDSVNAVLESEPYVNLTGLTGVGKSTFVEKYLKTDEGAGNTLYIGESKIIQWARDNSSNRKILFIDEANLSKKEWSEFEGLFNKPPGILYKGTFYPLTENHKVVFASNPLSYGDARHLSPLFERHGNSLVFEPLPLDFIYEEILKPTLAGSLLAEHAEILFAPLLQVYQFICEIAVDEILISPRELQMMALQMLSYWQIHHEENPLLIAQWFAYNLGKDLVPTNHRAAFEIFRPKMNLSPTSEKETCVYQDSTKFVMTPSRQVARDELNQLIQLRTFKRSVHACNEVQKYGGLGGIIYEGVAGVGKTELILDTLRGHDFKECLHYFGPPQIGSDCDKIFYRMPVTLTPKEKKKFLMKAFHEGAIVLIDEINSGSFNERLLNSLSMGKDLKGNPPKNPGFMIFGTQNPTTYSGRREASNALKRRFINKTLQPYSEEEIKTILIKNKGIHEDEAQTMAQAFQNCILKAKKEGLKPEPVFRDIIHFVDSLKNHTPSINRLIQEHINLNLMFFKLEKEEITQAKKILSMLETT